MSATQKYIDFQLEKERKLIFDEAEEEVITKVKKKLQEKGELRVWEELDLEGRLNLVRGYWERSHKVRDMVNAGIEIRNWRVENKIDTILKERMELHDIYHACWPSYIGGEDKWGHWIVFDRVTDFEIAALSKYDEDMVLLYRAQCLEALMRIKQETSKRLGYRVCQYIYMIDLKGLSIKKHFTAKVRALLQPLFKVSGDFYPDSLWGLYIINAPMSFRMIWRIISPWIDPVVKAKIKILSGENAYLKAMVKNGIPIDSIPLQIGGNGKTVMLKDVVEACIDTPEVENHHFTCNPAPSDPEAVAAHKKQLEVVNKRQSLTGRVAASLNFKTFRRKPSTNTTLAEAGTADSEVDPDIQGEGEQVFNEDEVLLQGWMSKQGNVNTAWKRRYFVLTPGGLYYYAAVPTRESHAPRGKIELHIITAVKAKTEGGEDAPETGLIEIETPSRVYSIRVESPEAQAEGGTTVADLPVADVTRRWVEAINMAVENDICAIDVEAVNDRSNENHVSAGFLQKRGVFNRRWRRRYFVLTSHALYYYNDIPTNVGASLKGRIDLYTVNATDISNRAQTEFTISAPGRTYYLKAESPEEAAEWLTTISTTVEKEHEAKDRANSDTEHDLNDPAQPPMIRSLPEDEEQFLERSQSGVITQLTSLAQEFLSVAADMGVLRKDEEPIDTENMMKEVRKRVILMFKLF